MNKSAIFHRTYSEYSFALAPNRVIIRLRVAKGDMDQCILYCCDRMADPAKTTTEHEMRKKYSDRLFDYYEADVTVTYTRLKYYFYLTSGETSTYYYNDEFHDETPKNGHIYYKFHYIRQEDIPEVPEWAKNAIIYQIFPDSFATSKAHISDKAIKVIDENGLVCESMRGGTLQGIISNINYLVDLGINCIYLTPIFKAAAWHKYDTIDYMEIDPCFGTKQEFKELVSICHKNEIKVILDGVFNHSGFYFAPFQEVLKNGKNATYKDWFYPKEYPLNPDIPNYECFAYFGQMPKLNTGNPDVIEYLINVGCYWIKEFDIDGWRLDVANEVQHDFWRYFRKSVRAIKEDVFLIGELWDDSRSFLQGDQFDSVMNYNLLWACRDFFGTGKLNANEFSERVQYLLMRYPWQMQQVQMNLLDSHDESRFLSIVNGDKNRLKAAALFLMTYVGTPMIFYGDEKGITGIEECDYRQPMVWNKKEDELFLAYKKLIELRKNYMDAMAGAYDVIQEDKNTLSYLRTGEKNKVLVVINGQEAATGKIIELPESVQQDTVFDYISGNIYPVDPHKKCIKIDLKPFEGKALIIK